MKCCALNRFTCEVEPMAWNKNATGKTWEQVRILDLRFAKAGLAFGVIVGVLAGVFFLP